MTHLRSIYRSHTPIFLLGLVGLCLRPKSWLNVMFCVRCTLTFLPWEKRNEKKKVRLPTRIVGGGCLKRNRKQSLKSSSISVSVAFLLEASTSSGSYKSIFSAAGKHHSTQRPRGTKPLLCLNDRSPHSKLHIAMAEACNITARAGGSSRGYEDAVSSGIKGTLQGTRVTYITYGRWKC